MNAANFDQYGLLSHPVTSTSHQHHVGSHHHHQQQQQQHHQQHANNNFTMSHSNQQGDEIFIARQAMLDSFGRLTTQMKHASEMCDKFINVVARQNPQVAALMLAQPGNVSNASAQGGVSAPFDFLNIANGAGHAASVAAATNDSASAAGSGGIGAKKQKVVSKLARRREKRLRDPDAPKRPPSAYLLFQNEVRQEIRKKHPDMPYAEILGKVSEAWKDLSDDQRKIYQDRTTENMAQWNQQKKEHEASMPNMVD